MFCQIERLRAFLLKFRDARALPGEGAGTIPIIARTADAFEGDVGSPGKQAGMYTWQSLLTPIFFTGYLKNRYNNARGNKGALHYDQIKTDTTAPACADRR